MKKGIDVSKHQGVIDWANVKADGVQFAILRAGYGRLENQVDQQFSRNVAGAKAVSMPIGAYWYSYAVSVSEGLLEAEVFLKTVKGVDFTYPLFFDQEYEPSIKALDRATRTAICKAFIGRVRSAGYNCGMYASKDWLENWIDAGALGNIPIWVAQYGNKCGYKGRYDLWQYSSKERVSGINGNVDMNECYTDFGAEEQPPTTSTPDPTPDSTGFVTVSGRWQETAAGWTFATNDGSKTGGKWLLQGGHKYFFDPDGIALTGAHLVSGKAYYFVEKGSALFKECEALGR